LQQYILIKEKIGYIHLCEELMNAKILEGSALIHQSFIASKILWKCIYICLMTRIWPLVQIMALFYLISLYQLWIFT